MFLLLRAVSRVLSTHSSSSIANASSAFSALLPLAPFGARSLTGANESILNHPRKNKTLWTKLKPKKRKPDFAKGRGPEGGLPSFGPTAFRDKPAQEFDEYDGFGSYKWKPHYMPNKHTQRDVQRRRVLKNHAEERLRVNCIRKASVLPSEIRKIADAEIHDVPRASSITNVNRRCVVTGRARGIFHQYRVSRFIYRAEADYNRVSGAQRAQWLVNTKIDP